MASGELFTRDEALAGLPARRAASLLFLIESRSAHFEARSRLLAQEFPTEKAAQELDLAFLEAFALSREPPLRVTIQNLERHAEKWAHLIPSNPRLRAAVAHLLVEKYSFTQRAMPGIRAALGLDQPEVQHAYNEGYGMSLDSIIAPRVTLIERLQLISTAVTRRIDSLPPFWTTFLLVLTLSLPQSVLALPIATAGLGPLAGVALLVFFGLFNVVTMACMAEAFARNGSIRYGSAFTGRMVSDYVGPVGSMLLVTATAMRLFIGLLACYYGLSVTMASFTSIPASLWTGLLFSLALYLLIGKSLNFSTALSASLGAVSTSLVVIISLTAFNHIQWANLSYVNVPLIRGQPFERTILQVIFGIVIQSYLGHTYLTQCAKIVLPRDPGGASLVWGTVAASVAMTALLCGWVLAINGVVVPSLLIGQSGTVLTPLARQIGVHVNIPGFALVILLLGLAFIRQSTVLFNLARERIPTRTRSMVMLPLRRAGLLLSQSGMTHNGPRVGLTYLGLGEGLPQFRLDIQLDGKVRRLQIEVDKSWDIAALIESLPELRPHGISLALEVAEATPESAKFRVISTMNLEYEGEWSGAGLHLADVSTLKDPLRQLVNWMTRQGESNLAEISAHIGADESITRLMLDELIELGAVQSLASPSDPRYRIHPAERRGRQLPDEIWRSLDRTVTAPRSARPTLSKQPFRRVTLWLRGALLSKGGRIFLSLTPVIIVFLMTEWLVVTGTSSFTELLAVAGLLANSLISGIFPVLLLVSSRRKGDLVPHTVLPLLGHPLVVTIVYLFFIGTLFLHGAVIWLHPVARAGAISVALLVLAATVAMARQGAFTRRLIVELKEDSRREHKGRAVYNITASGKPAPAEVELSYAEREERQHGATGELPGFAKLRSVTFHLPATPARELKIWTHKVTPDGNSQGLPAIAELRCGSATRQFDLQLSSGQIVLPVNGKECRLQLTFPESEAKWQIQKQH